jgi:choline dehydrogenase
VLGGGSSINLMVWSHGHNHDWGFFAHEAVNKTPTYIFNLS